MSGCYDYNDYRGNDWDNDHCYKPRRRRRRHQKRYEGCWDYNYCG
ncbi:hypothetical protein [Cryptosporangium minutisporangium]